MLSFKHVVITASLLLPFLVRAELPPGTESLDLMPWPRQVVLPDVAQNSVLKPLQPVAEQVQRLSELGLMLLDKWQKGQGISDSYRQLAQRQLDDAALVQDEVVIAMVNPLTRLLNALKVQ